MINGGIHPAKTPSRNNSILPIASPLWSLPINDGHSCLLCAWPLTSDNLETATKLRPQSSIAGARYHFRKKFLASTLKKRDPTLVKRNALAAYRRLLRRHDYLACESFAAPVEVNFALLRADQSLNYARAKPMARRRRNGRAAAFCPPKDESFTDRAPVDLHMAFR